MRFSEREACRLTFGLSTDVSCIDERLDTFLRLKRSIVPAEWSSHIYDQTNKILLFLPGYNALHCLHSSMPEENESKTFNDSFAVNKQ